MAKAKKVATKSIDKTTKASKSATPAKKAAAKPAAAQKVATTQKAEPAKKETTTTKKAVVKKAAPVKKAAVAVKKAAPVKKAVIEKKAEPAQKAAPQKASATPATKAAVAKKAAPVKKAAETAGKKSTVKKAVDTPKKNIEKKAIETKKAEAPQKVASKTMTKENIKNGKSATAPKKTLTKAKKSKETLMPLPSVNEIEDRIGRKSTVKQSKDGAVAIIDLNRKSKKVKISTEEESEIVEPKLGSSILDVVENVGPAYRYSDDDLKEFKEIILKRLETARENLNYYQALMSRKDESGTNDTDNRFNSMEDGSGVMEREQLSQLAARQMQFIDHLEKAIMRIENKTYGVCRVTGKLIDKARLRAVPHATLSMEAKSNRR